MGVEAAVVVGIETIADVSTRTVQLIKKLADRDGWTVRVETCYLEKDGIVNVFLLQGNRCLIKLHIGRYIESYWRDHSHDYWCDLLPDSSDLDVVANAVNAKILAPER